jgi:hypothetical protein
MNYGRLDSEGPLSTVWGKEDLTNFERIDTEKDITLLYDGFSPGEYIRSAERDKSPVSGMIHG